MIMTNLTRQKNLPMTRIRKNFGPRVHTKQRISSKDWCCLMPKMFIRHAIMSQTVLTIGGRSTTTLPA